VRADWSHLEPFRRDISIFPKMKRGDRQGAFQLSFSATVDLVVIAHDGGWSGDDWEHVSARAHQLRALYVPHGWPERIPTWEEMCWVKDQFWKPEEAVMQLHPPASEYVNVRATVLHLWRPVNGEIPLPPREYV
jgi:hypothetical protein